MSFNKLRGSRYSSWQTRWRLFALVFDFLALFVALGGAAALRFRTSGAIERILPQSLDPSELVNVPWLALLPLWLAVGVFNRLYNPGLIRNAVEEARRIVSTCLGASIVLIIVSFATKSELSRLWLITATLLSIPLLFTSRRALRAVVNRRRKSGDWLARAVVVGGPAAQALVARLLRDPSAGFNPVGTVGFEFAGIPSASVAELEAFIKESHSSALVVVGEDLDRARTDEIVAIADGLPVDVLVLPGLNYALVHSLSVVGVGTEPALSLETPGLRRWQKTAKRGMDLVGASLGLVMLMPIFIVVAITIAIADGRPILFRQLRIGHDTNTFRVFKFRTMRNGSDTTSPEEFARLNETDGLLFKSRKDPRITSVGRILRKLSIDEMPQLFNVFNGDMSLVGPRPALPSEVSLYDDLLLRRLQVKPGLTGLWQVSGRSDLPFEEYVRLDLTYVRNWSIMLDLYIIARTIPAVMFGRGAR